VSSICSAGCGECAGGVGCAVALGIKRRDELRRKARARMSPKKPGKGGSPIEIGASAKLEIRKSIKETVPEDVTRAKADAWLDLIKPITQWAGLKGDALEYKRKLLRIQQEETLLRIGMRMRERISQAEGTPKPIPTKALVPLLEKASLEDPESALIEAWANLGASAALNYDVEVIEFLEILAKIGVRERNILERLIGGAGLGKWKEREARALAGLGFEIYNSQPEVRRLVGEAIEAKDQGIFDQLKRFFPDGYPLIIVRVGKGIATETANRPDKIVESEFFKQNATGFELLKKNELIQESSAGLSWNPRTGEQPLFVGWCTLTELGFAFVKRILGPPLE
jgi:hypothetical protein